MSAVLVRYVDCAPREIVSPRTGAVCKRKTRKHRFVRELGVTLPTMLGLQYGWYKDEDGQLFKSGWHIVTGGRRYTDRVVRMCEAALAQGETLEEVCSLLLRVYHVRVPLSTLYEWAHDWDKRRKYDAYGTVQVSSEILDSEPSRRVPWGGLRGGSGSRVVVGPLEGFPNAAKQHGGRGGR